jgi:hypothetical protein
LSRTVAYLARAVRGDFAHEGITARRWSCA